MGFFFNICPSYRYKLQMKPTNKIFYLILVVLALAVNFAGINLKFFTDDPGLYASIAKNLIYKNHFWELFTYNYDWLDKPHFPFWMIFCSFKLFGISEWAYRLPALLFFMVSVLYTWLFTKKYYDKETAIVAVLILTTALNTMLANTDVRAEPYLMGLIIAAIYHISALNTSFSVKHLLLAALFTASAVMTKGIFVVIAVYGALLGHLWFTGHFKSMFRLKWLWLALLTIIFTLPEFYSLYIQFDLHPEKTVFGRQHVSGIKWFLWDSQFGRFVNNGPITRKISGSIFFYLHTLLWAFAPWCLLFYFAVVSNVRAFIHRSKLPEYFAFSGGILLLLLFSLSRFQLPFYTNALFPLFAIITAPLCLCKLNPFGTKFRVFVLWIFIVPLPIAVILSNTLLKPASNFAIVTDVLLFGIIAALVIIKLKEPATRTFLLACLSVLFAGFYINTVFYNEIVPYKGQIAAAEWVNQNLSPATPVYVLNAENNLFQFYCKRPVGLMPMVQFDNLAHGDALFYVNQQTMDQLVQSHASIKIVRSFVDYPKENLSLQFIDRSTRIKTLGQVYVVSKN
jgi:4-amino-4-deoxy-L-arabinose transferase-like glycosyltransferase